MRKCETNLATIGCPTAVIGDVRLVVVQHGRMGQASLEARPLRPPHRRQIPANSCATTTTTTTAQGKVSQDRTSKIRPEIPMCGSHISVQQVLKG